MTKLTRKINISTLTKTSSIMPLGYCKVFIANYKLILVAFGSPKSNFLKEKYDIKLILAHKSANVLFTVRPPIKQAIVKLSGS